MQVFTNLQFKLFWALGLFCYVLFIGEAGWGQSFSDLSSGQTQDRSNCHSGSSYAECGFQGVGQQRQQAPTIMGSSRRPSGNQGSSGRPGGTITTCEGQPRPAGMKGCYNTVRNSSGGILRCDWGINFCTSKDRCERNVGANHWNPDSGSCQSTPYQSKQADRKGKCDDGQSENEDNQCVCSKSGNAPVDGKCEEETADRDDKKDGKDLAKICTNEREGQWIESDKTCYCEGGPLNLDDPKSTCKYENKSIADVCKEAGGSLGIAVSNSWQPNECVCESSARGEYAINPNNQKCETAQIAEAPTEDDIDQVLRECGFTEAEDKIAKCVASSYSAIKKCDKEAIESDKNNETAKGILSIVGGVHQQKGVQAGNAEVCSDVAKKTTGAYWLIDEMKKDCNKEIETCKAACVDPMQGTNWEELNKKCTAAFQKRFPGQFVSSDVPLKAGRRNGMRSKTEEYLITKGVRKPSASDKEHLMLNEVSITGLRSGIAELKGEYDANVKRCETDAPVKERDVVNYLEDVLKGWVSANACKNAATTNANRCAQLGAMLTPQWCLGRTSEPCCSYVDGGLQCNGKDSTHIHCICQKNQSDSRCITTTGGGGGNAQLGAPGSTANLAAPGGIKAGASNKPSNFSNDGFAVNEDPNANGKGPTAAGGSGGSPFGGTSGGGGGGAAPGAASGGGAGDGKAAQGDGESQGLVGGAFSALKTLSDRVFGGGGSVGKTGTSTGRGAGLDKNGKKKIDPEKWRPTGLRGVAGAGSELGPKNRDIWKQMNSQYATQYHTFLDGVGK